MVCECCHNTGIFTFVGGRKICTCKKGRQLLELIKEGDSCPICNNTGVYPVYDPVYHTVDNMYFCKCKHGQEAEEKTKNDPNECPICHGTGRYAITTEKGKKMFMGHCIHLIL